MANVSIYRDSTLEAEHVLEFGARHVALATGSTWRRDGIGRDSGFEMPGFDLPGVFTPDDLMKGRVPSDGPVIIWDDDHYYMGGVLAERCRTAGLDVTLVTPAAMVSAWTVNTLEAVPIAKRIARLGIDVVHHRVVTRTHHAPDDVGAHATQSDHAELHFAMSLLLMAHGPERCPGHVRSFNSVRR